MIEVTLKDGSKKSYQSGTNVYDIARISVKVLRAAVAAEINGKVTDLNTSLYEDCT